jgi:hypothetical protein
MGYKVLSSQKLLVLSKLKKAGERTEKWIVQVEAGKLSNQMTTCVEGEGDYDSQERYYQVVVAVGLWVRYVL